MNDELKKKTEEAIEFIQKAAAEAEYFDMPLTVCFSGGKDSQVLYDLTKKAGVKCKYVYSVTTNDPPENVRFIRDNYPDVEFLHPKRTFLQLVELFGLPTMRYRFCCTELKEKSTSGFNLTGVRAEESSKRAKYPPLYIQVSKYKGGANLPEYSRDKMRKNRKVMGFPILKWLEWEVWQYIEDNNIPINPVYDMCGRVGCLFCPFATKKQILFYKERYPRYYKLLLRAEERHLKNSNKSKKIRKYTEDPEEIFNWWISNKSLEEYFKQQTIKFE